MSAHDEEPLAAPVPVPGDGSAEMSHEASAPSGWYRRFRWWQWCLVGLLAVVVAVLGVFAVQGLMVKSHEERAVAIAKEGARDGDLAGAVARMGEETAKANDITHNVLWKAMARIPLLGVNVRSVQGMTDVADGLVKGAVTQYVDALGSVSLSELVHDGQINVMPIVSAAPGLIEATDSLRAEVDRYNALPTPNIGPLTRVFETVKGLLNDGIDYADLAMEAVPNLPEYLGYKGKQTYAILAVTNAEMRAGGGLVGAIGTLSFEDGRMEVGEFRSNRDYLPYGTVMTTTEESDLYRTEGPLYMSYDVRDLANSPDPHRIADMFNDAWKLTPWGKETPLNGIIMVDPVTVQEMVKDFGDVTLPDGRVLNGSNTAEFLLNTVYREYDTSDTDKYFGLVAEECIDRVMGDMDAGNLARFLSDVPTLVRNRHITLYSFTPSLESIIVRAGLIPPDPLDESEPMFGVYLTEQNASKMGWYIKRSTKITQEGCSTEGKQTYHVEYTLTNTLRKDEVASLPQYVTGIESENVGTGYEKIVFMPPRGGGISNFQVEGNGGMPEATSLNWVFVYKSLTQVQPESSVTYSFDVTTSPWATERLVLDETPGATVTPQVTYDSNCIVP